MSNIYTAHAQYAKRPKDERFNSVEDLIGASFLVKEACLERRYNLKDLRFEAGYINGVEGLTLVSPKGQAVFNHWSFGQAARMLESPAGFLRDKLTPKLVSEVLNHRISQSAIGSTANLLVRTLGPTEFPLVRACTSETYGRVWDCNLYDSIQKLIMKNDSSWELPMTWEGVREGAYAGTNDSFLIITNGGSVVSDPSLWSRPGNGDQMFRGLIVRNSEVGACSIQLEQILFRFICGNHILWGASIDKRYRRRHYGVNTEKDAVKKIAQIAFEWSQTSPQRDEEIIKKLVELELATTKDAVIDELRSIGATKEQAEKAYDTCERQEAASPRSFWGITQGFTRISQESGYQDDRLVLDQLAAKVLSRGSKLVAA